MESYLTKSLLFYSNECQLINPEFPYGRWPPFNLDRMNEVECRAEFKVDKGDIPVLAEALHIPTSFITQRRSNVDGIEGLCMLLKRLAYPCRYSDMMAHFARPVACGEYGYK